MTLYRLPDTMGGREVDCTLYEKEGNTWLWFSLHGEWMVHVRSEGSRRSAATGCGGGLNG
jgi:hypothetical protein